jgi:probable HAF family extracellular repeat protein
MLSFVVMAMGAAGCAPITDVSEKEGVGVVAAAEVASVQGQGGPGVEIVDLGTFGGPNAHAFGVNARGDVVGGVGTEPQGRAFLWSPRSGFQDLGTLGGLTAIARGINARGDVVGKSARAPVPNRAQAFLWTRKTGMIDLLPDHDIRTEAFAINDRGDVAGTLSNLAFVAQPGPRAFFWSEKDGLTELGNLPGGEGSGARAINNRGQVVGEASAGPGAQDIHGFLWSKTDGLRDLGYMGPIPSNAGPKAINDHGHIAGIRVLADPPVPGANSRAVFWTESEGFVDLLPPGALRSIAMGINDRDQVVGAFVAMGGLQPQAFLWSRHGGFVILPSLGGGNTQATAINDAGDIVGWSRAPTGENHAVMWRVRGGGE